MPIWHLKQWSIEGNNDINEDTRTQLELISEALAKLEVKHKYVNRPRKRIGFIQDEEDIN